MKAWVTISLFCTALACKSPTFTYIKEVDHTQKNLYEFEIDKTYSVYTRTICKDKNNFPIDCVADSIPPVEVGYIIISDAHKKVLVINNVPNRKQKFFEQGIVYEKAIQQDTVLLINAFFFKQFRFGTLEDALFRDGRMKFITAEKHPQVMHWEYDVKKDSVLTIASVANEIPDGQHIRYTDTGLYLVPRFEYSKYFKLVFQLPSNMAKSMSAKAVSTNLSRAKIFVLQKSPKSYITYIEFENPVYKEYKAIKFARNRMYAFSMSNEQ